MKKIHNLVIGGLQQKIFNLVLFTILLMILGQMAVFLYQSSFLGSLILGTTETERTRIHDTTDLIMDDVAKSSLATQTELQAFIASSVFTDLGHQVRMLGDMAGDLYEHPECYAPRDDVARPDLSRAGEVCTQILTAPGVDIEDPAIAEEIRFMSGLSEILSSSFSNVEDLDTAFISSPRGFMLLADAVPEEKFRSNGTYYNINVTARPWYTGAVETGGLYYTGLERDTFTDRIGIVCSLPIYHDGELVCVVGADVFLNSMEEAIKASADTPGFVCIIDQDGHVIFSPEETGIFAPGVSSDAVDLRHTANEALSDFITDAFISRTDTRLIEIGGKSYYVAGAPIDSVGWAIVNVIDFETVNGATVYMLDQFDGIVNTANEEAVAGAGRIRTLALVLTLIVMVLALAGALTLARRIVSPLTHMTREIKKSVKGAFTFEMQDEYRTGDEIEILASAFEAETIRNARYIKHLRTITAEKERISTELALATSIQEESLPNIFPPFPDRKDLDIFASMKPAKEVGGDFYDFFLLDDDHLAMVIADVSGKGVPAALFMMMSNILIKTNTMLGGSPREVLQRVNEQICSNNHQEMFVTAWLGIMTISTGEIVAANAGHEYPVIKKADSTFAIMKDKHGFVLGGLEGIRYKEYTFTLEKGGALFLYTDGVTEAVNADTAAFGTNRLLASLNEAPDADSHTLIANMSAALDAFVGTADQFDDVTMLAVKRL